MIKLYLIQGDTPSHVLHFPSNIVYSSFETTTYLTKVVFALGLYGRIGHVKALYNRDLRKKKGMKGDSFLHCMYKLQSGKAFSIKQFIVDI